MGAQDELDDVSALPKALSPVTVNQQGEVQAELALPLEMQSLQSLPDASPLVARGERMLLKIADNLPTREQLDSLVQSVSNLFPEKEEVKVEAVEQLQGKEGRQEACQETEAIEAISLNATCSIHLFFKLFYSHCLLCISCPEY